MRRQGQQSVVCCSVLRAIQRFCPVGINTLNGHLNRLHVVVVPLQGELDDGVQGDVDVRDFLGGRLEEVPQDAAQHGLVGDGEDVGFALELREDRNEAIHDVYVRFALGVAVLELLTVTQG